MSDDDLKKAISEIEKGLVNANLGGNVYKQRIGVHGKGKRGSHRIIILMKVQDKPFLHTVFKGKKGNIKPNELEGFKVMAEAFLGLSDEQITILVDEQKLIEVL